MEADRLKLAELAAKRQIGQLRHEINSHGSADKTNLEDSHSRLQQEISKARFVLRHLSTCQEAAGNDPSECGQVATLQGLLEAAVVQRSVLYESVFGREKKDSLNSFKDSVYALIERGEAPSWISTVSKNELINHGQEANRLFQLLVEGKGGANGIPLVDSVTLDRAAERTDLFTLKQCDSLRSRSLEVENMMQRETERLFHSLQEEESLMRFPPLDDSRTQREPAAWACDKCTCLNQADEVQCTACCSQRCESFLTIAKRKPKTIINKKETARYQSDVLLKKRSLPNSATHEVWLRNKYVPEMIGPGGTNQRNLIAKSGALSVYAHQNKLDKDDMCPISVHGSHESFEKVVAILEKRFGPKPPQAVEAKQTIWISNKDVPDMIGSRGATVQRIKQETGAKSITARQDLVDKEGMCPIIIQGSPEAVKKASTSIMNMFCGVTEPEQPRPSPQKEPSVTEAEKGIQAMSLEKSALPTSTGKERIVEALIPGNTDPTMRENAKSTFTTSDAVAVSRRASKSDNTSVQVPRSPTSTGRTNRVVVETHASSLVSADTHVSASERLNSALGVPSFESEASNSTLFLFLKENEKCLTCPAKVFHDWLESVHIASLEDFKEALDDDDFVSLEMKANGLKYFKRFALQKAAAKWLTDAMPPQTEKASPSPSTKPMPVDQEPPPELVCPIRQVLMTNDPVVAADGFTYEREAIESWLQRQGDGALSPMTQEPFVDFKLVSNTQIRTMARDWNHRRSQA
jgi:hypothetical protein